MLDGSGNVWIWLNSINETGCEEIVWCAFLSFVELDFLDYMLLLHLSSYVVAMYFYKHEQNHLFNKYFKCICTYHKYTYKTHLNIFVFIYLSYVHIHIHIHIHVHIYTHIHIYIYIYIHVHTQTFDVLM